MFTKIRARFSSAHIMAAMALFIVLGGSAYAAKKIGTKKIKDGAVTTVKLADGAVTTPKLAADAATGAKVDEASLGKVPSAAAADKATSADSATTANSATTAETAANATDADDSDQLEGRTLSQVRGLADATSDQNPNALPDAGFEEVLTEDLGIPIGGADLIAHATIVVSNGAGQAGIQCELRSDGAAISERSIVTLPANFDTSLSLTGFANDLPGTGIGDPENIGVFCQGSIAPGQVDFETGNLVVERVPVGTGA